MFVTQYAAGGLHLTFRCTVAQVIHNVGGATHPGQQIGCIGVHRRKYETPVTVVTGQLLHAVLRVVLVEAGPFVSRHMRYA